MLTIRAVTPGDHAGLLALAVALGPGMTTLPPDGRVIADLIDRSRATFAGKDGPESAFLLVLAQGERVVGCAGVYPEVGRPYGFYSYRSVPHLRHCAESGLSVAATLLHPSNELTGATEIGTLVVDAGIRGDGIGKLLARSRYMLMAACPARFQPTVFAEMRGWQDDEGRSPFWDAVGARLFKMDFATADRMSAAAGAGFIGRLLPQTPICAELLPAPAAAAIGRPHALSARALQMLVAEGFRYDGLVDVFDAGPQVTARRDDIATVRAATRRQVAAGDTAGLQPCLVATVEPLGFRVAAVPAALDDGMVRLASDAQRSLDVTSGDELLVVPR